MESSRKFFKEKISDHKDFSKKKFGRLYGNKLKNLMRKIFTLEKQYQIKKLKKKKKKHAGAREAALPVVAASPPPPPCRQGRARGRRPAGARPPPVP